MTIVLGSPEAAAIRDDLVYGATRWYSVECANRHCRRKHCSTMLYDEIADALAEWRQFHPDTERK